jgi:hypothetical protein
LTRWFLLLAALFLVACAKPLEVSGLKPLSQTADDQAPILESSQPALRWEPFPRPADLEADPKGWVSRVSHVTYDLRIWRAERDHFGHVEVYPAELVYTRSALSRPQHTLESPLASETQYVWSVRARFELDGRTRVTPWGVLLLRAPSTVADPRSMLVPPRGYYRFVTPRDPDGRTGGGSD